MENYGIDNGARGSSKVSLICLPPNNTTQHRQHSTTHNTAPPAHQQRQHSPPTQQGFRPELPVSRKPWMIVILLCVLLYSCLLCLTSGQSTQKKSLFVHRGLNVNWSPFNFAHSEAFSTLLLNWISARLSWGWAFWVVWAEGRKIARKLQSRASEKSKWELGEIEMGIANGPPRKWTNWNQIRVVCARYLSRNLVHLVPWFSPKRR